MGKIGFFPALAISLGSVIGTGIFVIPSVTVEELKGLSLPVWIAVGLLSLPMAFSVARLSALFPRSGGPMLFVKSAFGEFPGFLAGWLSWTAAVMTIASLGLAISKYLSALVPVDTRLTAFAVISAFTLLNYAGLKFGYRVQVVLTAATLGILLTFLSFGAASFDPENLDLPWVLSLPALLLVLEPFIGWETLSIMAGEVRNAKRAVPSAIKVTAVTVFVLYTLLILSLIGAGVSSLPDLLPPGLYVPAIVSVILVNLACLNSWILSASRLPVAMVKERLLSYSFGKISRFGTPSTALFVQALLSFFAVSFDYEGSIYLILASALLMYLLCFLSLLKIRRDPLAAVSAAASVFFILLLFSVPGPAAAILPVMAMAVPSFVLVKISNDREFVERFYDSLAWMTDKILPRSYVRERREAVKNADIKPGHTVLDYGCNTGASTREILRIPAVKVVAVDIAKKPMERAAKKLRKERKGAVFVKLTRPAPFEDETFDRIVSVGALDHFENPVKELESLRRVLKKGGKASFLAFGRSFGIPPERFLRSDRTLKSVFRRAGFENVRIERRKSGFAEFVFVVAERR